MLFSFMVVIFIFHFIGDWLLQSRWMGDNKSKLFEALLAHVLTYGLVMSIGVSIWSIYNTTWQTYDLFWMGQVWVFVNVILHGITDKVSSHFTSKLYKENKIHGFFAVIGADGMTHYLTMLVTARLIIGI